MFTLFVTISSLLCSFVFSSVSQLLSWNTYDEFYFDVGTIGLLDFNGLLGGGIIYKQNMSFSCNDDNFIAQRLKDILRSVMKLGKQIE